MGSAGAAQGREYSKRTSLRLLRELLGPYKGLAAATLALLLIDVVGMLYVPTELSALVNTAVSGGSHDALVTHGLVMLVSALAGSGGCIASYWFASRLAARVGRDLRVRVYEQSLSLTSFEFSQLGTGSMITRTLSDANVVQQTLVMSFLMLAPLPVICVVAIVLAYGTDAIMGHLLLVVTLTMLAISAVAVTRSAPIFLRLQEFIDHMNSRLRESITGMRVIRAFGKEAHERTRLGKTFEEYAKNAIRVNLVFSITDASCFFLMNVAEFAVMWLGADRVGAHAMQIGSITAFVQYVILILFFTMMAQFAILQLPRAMACLTRAAEVLDIRPSILDPATKVATLPHSELIARFDHVSFRFADASEDTLHDLCLSLRRGQMTAIIGNTGSGKSTIAKMLLRFNDVSSGKLCVLGADVRSLTQAQLRARMAYVPQKAWLFSGTIAENLRDADPQASDERLWHAIGVAQADFVRELPDGLDAPVAQGGTNFSGGQRQRLAIARALVRRADLYIFDDSFSALDYRTDAALRHALSHELAGAAVLIIAQRVSTIREAAQIVVLKEGRIVGVGTHEMLMEDCEDYRSIVESQERGGTLDG